MFSRFWYFVLAAAAGFALAAALLAQTSFNREADAYLDDQLRRDRLELEQWLRLEARTRLDAIGPLAAHSKVREALSEASRAPDGLPAASKAGLETTLQDLNRQLDEGRAELLLAVDADGDIVVQLGGSPPPAGASLGELPLVRDALRGYLRDDVWVYNGRVYRVAARPVLAGAGGGLGYVGAIVHGMSVDERLARVLGDRVPGATVGFFHRDHMLATFQSPTEGAPSADQLLSGVEAALVDERLRAGERSAPIRLGDAAVGVYSLVTGAAAQAGVGYVVARPRERMSSAFQLFSEAPADDLAALPWWLIVLVPLALGLLGLLFSYLERDKPFRAFRRALSELPKAERPKLASTDFRGAFRAMAEDVNEALDKAQRAGATAERPPADLDQLLGDRKSSPQPYFAFNPAAEPSAPAPSAPAPSAPPAAPPAAPSAPPPAAAPSAPPAPPAPSAPPPPPPSAAAPLPPLPPAARPSEPASSHFSFADQEDDDDGATMVAAIPQELLAATGDPDRALEEAHFREVYDEFVALKRRCGEPTANLTYDKFAATLRKNKESIVARHGASRVRFTVYEKGGKAALKATPIR